MIVDDLDAIGITLSPRETDPELVVDPDRVLALSVAGEFLQPVTGRDPQVAECLRRMD
jgi:hypothetical protein